MADWFVGPVMDKIIDACSDYLQDQFRRQTGMKEELDRLRENRPKIQAIVSAYTRAQIKDPALNRWIWQLRDAIDEADDVLDDFEYTRLEEHLELNMEEAKVRSSFTRLFLEPARKLRRVCRRGFKIDPNLERLEAVVKKLDKVSAEVKTFRHLIENAKQEQQELELQLCKDRETGCLPKNDLLGRGEEKDFIMQWLRKPTNEDPTHIASPSLYKNISLLSVVGHGGMGKTALLQHIYEDLKDKFELKMWVCVSNDFDAKKIIANMLECINKERPRLESLAAVEESLKAVVQSKRFLLVLDDIWEEDGSKWENVLSPLTNGSSGSKILITTRMDAVASAVAKIIKKKMEILRIKSLEEDVCLKLLNNHAFAGMENLGAHKKLTDIASSIVKKLSGSPLAAKIIGGALNSNLNESFWMNILNCPDVLNVELEPGRNNIFPVLRLSFTFLPQPLQNCFAFCGIFPQDYWFDKDDLVRMWIALGFIQESSIEGETLEDIGGRYFDILVRKSFFDQFQDDLTIHYRFKFQNDENIYYKMHDLLHDLAKSISSEECFGFVGDKVLSFQIPENVRHLFVESGNLEVLRMIKNVKNLHSLFLINDMDGDQTFTEILIKIFEASKNIRLLFIRSRCLKKMPETINKLRHLRYFNHNAWFAQMPRSLSSLYHLRFIIYQTGYQKSCYDDLLGDVSNLSNLRHLELPDYVSVHGIGKLTSLQGLNNLIVKKENGYRIGELEHLSQLRKLKIQFLENVKDAREACTANLFDKRKLTDLFLNWGYTVDDVCESQRRVGSLRSIVNSDLDVNVLENLEPYKNLKSLSIVSYEGASSAKWMYNADLISNLEYIRLDDCLEWETLPPFGQLPHLKSLYLRNMPKVKRFDYNFHGNDKVDVFPSLEVLNIKGLQVLEDWFDGAGAAYNSFFPCLTELLLDNCPKLQKLPYLPTKLKKMKIRNIGWKAALNFKQKTHNARLISNLEYISLNGCSEWETLPPFGQLPHLKSLYLRNMPKAKRIDYIFHGNDKGSVFPSLEVLNIQGLQVLEDWFDGAGAAAYDSFFPCLTELLLYNCPNLQELPYLPPKLEKMLIDRVGWKSLNSKKVTSKSIPLETLEVFSCPNITSLLLEDVGKLIIEGCPNLISLGGLQQVESGIEKFQHILSEVVIDDPSLLPTVGIASLEKLTIHKNDVLVSLTTEVEQWFPHFSSSLGELNFESLKSLQSLPSSLQRLSSLKILRVHKIPQLQQLPHIPACLERLELQYLESLVDLPSSLSTISSLKELYLRNIPLLKSLPDLPSSLISLSLVKLDKLECLPSSLSAISSLEFLYLESIPLLTTLPDLPSSLHELVLKNCNPELMRCYEKFSGSDWHKIAHIPRFCIIDFM